MPLNPIDEKFDPNQHEALFEQVNKFVIILLVLLDAILNFKPIYNFYKTGSRRQETWNGGCSVQSGLQTS